MNPLDYRPPRIAMAMLTVATALHLLLPWQHSYPFPVIVFPVLLISAGFTIMMVAWWQFRQRQVAIYPTATTDYLITDGIYRFTRNPMYLGMIAMLLGVALILGTLPFYGVAILYFVVINQWFCPYEEKKLAKAFGPVFDHYKSSVRRWI